MDPKKGQRPLKMSPFALSRGFMQQGPPLRERKWVKGPGAIKKTIPMTPMTLSSSLRDLHSAEWSTRRAEVPNLSLI